MSSLPAVTEREAEEVRDPRVDAWNDVPSGLAGSISSNSMERDADHVATALSEPTASRGSASASERLANVGTVTIEQFVGLAATLMIALGLYSFVGGANACRR